MSSGLILFVATIGTIFVQITNARCGDQNITDTFGWIHYDQLADDTLPEYCSWTFQPPNDTSSAVLILKLVSFPVNRATISRQNYLRLPGGNIIINKNTKQDHLFNCKAFAMSRNANSCSRKYLEEYCADTVHEAHQWPPTLSSYSSQLMGHGSTAYYNLGFTILYMFLPCPNVPTVTSKPTTTVTAANKIFNQSREDKKWKYIAVTEPINTRTEKNDSMTAAVKGIGSVAFLLVLGFCAVIVFLSLKLAKLRRAALKKYTYITHRDSESTYCYASDVNGGLDSSGAYAVVGSDRNRHQDAWSPNGYLTMRNQGSTKNKQYEEIKAAAQKNNLYATLGPKESLQVPSQTSTDRDIPSVSESAKK